MFYTETIETTLPVKRMNFRMPDYTKIMYGSGIVKKEWEPKVRAASSVWSEMEKLSLIKKIKPSILVFVHNWSLWKKWADQNDLILIALSPANIPKGYSSFGTAGNANGWRCAVTGSPSLAGKWMDAWHSNDNKKIGELLGYPDCCANFFEKYWVKEGYRDLTYPAFCADGSHGSPFSNILGRWCGIRFVSHMPCSFKCKESEKIGEQNYNLGIENGFKREVDIMKEFLEMPFKYSSLHGIAEITTPILKVSCASESYEEEVGFTREGTPPKISSSGKNFPFNNKAKSSMTESNAFKKAIEHYQSLEVDSKSYLNGFNNSVSQIKSHEPILKLCEDDIDSVLDLGCGNGALLAKIHMKTGAECYGIDINKSAILHGKELFDFLHLSAGDIFNFDFEVKNTSIFMPGRLKEVSEDKRSEMLEILLRFKYVIGYTYGDWMHLDIEKELGENWIALSEEKNDYCRAVKFESILEIAK